MAREIGRLSSFALGIEATAGTAGTLDAYIPFTEASLDHVVSNTKDESGRGRIEGLSDAHIVEQSSEFSAKGNAYASSIGYLIALAFGQATTPVLAETGVYTHTFAVKNDNNHLSATIFKENTNQDEQATYHMCDSLNFMFDVGEYVKYEFSSKGQGVTNATGLTPAYTTEEIFKVSKVFIKFANDIAGLGAAAKVPVQSAKINFSKNLEQIFSTASTVDAVDFATQHNKNFECSGEFEIVYDSTTYKNLAKNLTKQAIEITVEGTSLIGATKYNSLTFRVASAVLEDFKEAGGLNDIQTQTFGFVALYKQSESKEVEAILTNTKTTIYT